MSSIVAALILTHAVLSLEPAPQKIYLDEKKLLALESALPLVLEDHASTADMATLTPLYDALGFKPAIVPASDFNTGERAIYIGIVGKNIALTHRSLRGYAPDPAQSGEEAYGLHIGRNGIVVAGAGRDGMIHGIHTLVQLIDDSRKLRMNSKGFPAIPYTDITDYPDAALRGAYVRGPLTKNQIASFARIKCNMVIFESEDFYDLTPDKSALWSSIFADLRNAGITPVPVFEFFNVPDSLLRKAPSSVEGRSRIEKITLPDEDYCSITRRNIILTDENPIRISANGTPLLYRKDYLIARGSIVPPYPQDYAEPWMVRRIPGSFLPGNSNVEITYSYAPPGSNALCPNAPETLSLIKDSLKPLFESLLPDYIHCGFGDIGRINQDLRCRDTKKSNADQYAVALSMMQGVISAINPNTKIMIWADALLPDANAKNDPLSLSDALNKLPGDLLAVPRLDAKAFLPEQKGESVLSWLLDHKMKPIAAISGSAPALYRAAERLSSSTVQGAGMILMDADPNDTACALAFDKAWSRTQPELPWPEVFNPYFNSDLLTPSFEEVQGALWEFTESRILSGVSPEQIMNDFERYVKENVSILRNFKEETSRTEAFLRLLTRYLDLEQAYTFEDKPSLLRDLNSLVKQYGELDASVDAGRIEQIQQTIKSQSLFVPASILFGRSLTYYRPFTPPANAVPCKAPSHLEYADTEGKAQATLDFLVECGPIFRIDFETVNAATLSLFASDNGTSYDQVASLTSPTGNVRGPLLLAKPVNKRFLQLRVEALHGQAVLREVRAFFLKLPAATTCPIVTANTYGAAAAEHIGMLYASPKRLAVAPTEIRLSRDSQSLHIYVFARDPLPHAMSAGMKETDAPLWREESVEVCIWPPQTFARRFLVNPIGTKHDAMAVASNIHDWDPGWDGDWTAHTEIDNNGWNASITIPFNLLGGVPKSGENWKINFFRHRNNVEKETSAWSIDSTMNLAEYGLLSFE